MGVPTNWTELKAAVVALSVRDDLETMVGDFIGYAENVFQRELFSPEREASVTLTLTDNAAPLPADFGGVKLVYVDAARAKVLDEVTPARLRELHPTNAAYLPTVFAIEGENILFGATPPGGTTIILEYIEGITALGESNPTNWLLTRHPDVYVNTALAELFAYTRDADGETFRRGKAGAIIDSINRAGRRRKTNSGPLAASSRNTDAVLAFIRRR